jgi:recombination protein RecT
MSNQLQLYIRSGAVQGSIEQTLKDRADDFTTSLLTVINGNPVLQECDPQEVVRTALKAASMRLPIDPGLGLAYIIPYNNNTKLREEYQDSKGVTRYRDKWVKKYVPQLQIGWKGFIQLALRSGQYKTINVTDVREGEYAGTNRLTGSIDFAWIDDNDAREKLPVAGYVAYLKLNSGFEKLLYMTVAELEVHAKKFSKTYANGNGKWADEKPAMSRKTVVKLLISKWGPQSTEIQRALRADQAAMGDEDTYQYIDNDKSQHAAAPAATEPANGDDIVEGEVVDPPAPDDTDQTPKQPTEAEAPQAPVEKPQSVKEKAAAWAAKNRSKPSAEGTQNDDTVQGAGTQTDAGSDTTHN